VEQGRKEGRREVFVRPLSFEGHAFREHITERCFWAHSSAVPLLETLGVQKQSHDDMNVIFRSFSPTTQSSVTLVHSERSCSLLLHSIKHYSTHQLIRDNALSDAIHQHGHECLDWLVDHSQKWTRNRGSCSSKPAARPKQKRT
jgi:hypothetical protein